MPRRSRSQQAVARCPSCCLNTGSGADAVPCERFVAHAKPSTEAFHLPCLVGGAIPETMVDGERKQPAGRNKTRQAAKQAKRIRSAGYGDAERPVVLKTTREPGKAIVKRVRQSRTHGRWPEAQQLARNCSSLTLARTAADAPG